MSNIDTTTLSTGEVVDAVYLNRHVRDNLSYLRNRPAFRMVRTSNLAITGTSPQIVNYNRVDWDHGNGCNTGTGRYTVPRTGLWDLSAGMTTVGDLSQVSYMYIVTSHDEDYLSDSRHKAMTWFARQTVSKAFHLVQGEQVYMQIQKLRSTTVTIDGQVSPSGCFFAGAWLGDHEASD